MPKMGILVVLMVLAIGYYFRDDIRRDWLGLSGPSYSIKQIN